MPDDTIDIRSKCKHFRILIIGRANAGKTTILKKVCQSIEDPEIFSPSGNKIDLSTIEGSAERGLHDIENQLVFKSNPQFIFHDSRGFESASVDEVEKVKSFIKHRAESLTLNEQLHAIWYCLPTDTDRPLLEADKQFFNVHGTGKVPTVAIFTKFDGLITKAFGDLRRKGTSLATAQNQKFESAKEKLKLNFIAPLMDTEFRPSDHVRMDDMRLDSTNCSGLIEKTANVLDSNVLKLLFVSVQQNNIALCTKYAVETGMGQDFLEDVISHVLAWYPHFWVSSSLQFLPASNRLSL
ncbi:hypothetical protein C8R43DRAFT_134569 [Mycena crocata]|nr:hypothetical protein C8R43DRAFT_134569 [Mycena crocata]